jgi:methyl acetate hydrolase
MSLHESLDTLLQSGVAKGSVAGVSAAVTGRDAVLYEAAFGERALGGGVPMTVDTVGWIASMTKAITGAAAMQLVEQGKLDLDVPASRWAPYLGEVQVLEDFDASGKPRLRAPKRPVTLRHLLTHTAGFGYANWDEKIKRYTEMKSLPASNSGDIRGLHQPLVFDPGERWLYSIGIDWAGKIVEAVSGMSLGTYMRANIFAPLGMSNTGFKLNDEMRSRKATVHRRTEAGLETTGIETPQNPPAEMGGGGLYCTVGDYMKFIRMILNEGTADDGTRVLRAETVRTMSQNQMGDCRVCMLPTTNPAMTLDAEFFPGQEKTWGLTFMINPQQAPTGRSAGSLAWAGLANSYYWIDPAKGIGGVFLTQILPFVDRPALGLYLDFETAVYAGLA